jgi:FlaA1/EpsC-like NDP-sugar epimerase
LGKAVIIGEILAVLAVIGLYRFVGYSRVLFIVDAFVSWALLVAVRRSFTIFRHSMHVLRSPILTERRVFVLGTSEQAEMALYFLQGQRIHCTGLIDMNGGGDLGRHLWGAPVLGRVDDLGRLASRYGVFEVVLPESEPIPCSEVEFCEFCRRENLILTKLGLYAAEGRLAEKASAGIL